MGLLIPGHFHFFSIDYISSLEHSEHSTAVDFMNEGKTEKGKREGGRKVKRRGKEAVGSQFHHPSLGGWGAPGTIPGVLFSLFYLDPYFLCSVSHNNPLVIISQMRSFPRTWGWGP